MSARSGAERSWITVSIPRSGHHFLAALLEQSLAPRLAYCEFYGPDDCCRAIPCTRRTAPIVLQKHHDLDLSLPADLPGVTYIVQFRAPLMAMLSDREYLAKMEGEELARDRDHFVLWLGKRLAYYVLFWRKWLQEPKPGRVRVDYEELLADPASRLRRLFRELDVDCSESQLASAVALMSTATASFPAPLRPATFTARKGTDSRFFDAPLVEAFQNVLHREIGQPVDAQAERSPTGPDPALEHVFLADMARRQGDPTSALEHIASALRHQPKNRYLLLEQADLLAAQRRFFDASASVSRALADRPDDPNLLRRGSELEVEIALEHLSEARRDAAQLVALRPRDAGLHCHLASILIRLGAYGEALHHVTLATSFGSRDPHTWRFASEVFKLNASFNDAIEAVRMAIVLNQQEAEFHHHLGNLLAIVGRHDEAVRAQRQALALSPETPGWIWKLSVDLENAGQVAEARTVVEQGLARFPDHPALLHQQGRLGAPTTVENGR